MYSQFLLYPNAYRAHLGASLVMKIESLGCSKLGSLHLSENTSVIQGWGLSLGYFTWILPPWQGLVGP